MTTPTASRRFADGLWDLVVFGSGVVAAVVLLTVAGRRSAEHNFHPGFTRFHRDIAPDTKYYPTVREMMAIARERAAGGKILVIVGGNSILYGVGQPASHVWTEQLQRELGPNFAVVNFAMRGAGVTDCAAVVAEALRNECPKQIYLANSSPTQPALADGTIAYRWVFWEAYDKGLLIDDPQRASAVREAYQIRPDARTGLDELRIRGKLDSFLNFGDLWNRFTFAVGNTTWTWERSASWESFAPRRTFPDNEPDYLTFSSADRLHTGARFDAELGFARSVSLLGFTQGKGGSWEPFQPVWEELAKSIDAAIPRALRARTLVVLTRNSPYYLDKFTAAERQREDLAYQLSVQIWQQAGYEAIDCGRGYTIGDYGDRIHLSSTGGDKLAQQLAAEVRRIAGKLGY